MNYYHKKITYDNDQNYKIVSDELISNLFRISQIEKKLRKDNIQGLMK